MGGFKQQLTAEQVEVGDRETTVASKRASAKCPEPQPIPANRHVALEQEVTGSSKVKGLRPYFMVMRLEYYTAIGMALAFGLAIGFLIGVVL